MSYVQVEVEGYQPITFPVEDEELVTVYQQDERMLREFAQDALTGLCKQSILPSNINVTNVELYPLKTSNDIMINMNIKPKVADGKKSKAHKSAPTDEIKWTAAQTLALATARLEVENDFKKIGTKAKSTMWNKLAKNLTELFGVDVSGFKCSEKYRNMIGTYRANKDKEHGTGRDAITWEYYDLFDSVLRENESVSPNSQYIGRTPTRPPLQPNLTVSPSNSLSSPVTSPKSSLSSTPEASFDISPKSSLSSTHGASFATSSKSSLRSSVASFFSGNTQAAEEASPSLSLSSPSEFQAPSEDLYGGNDNSTGDKENGTEKNAALGKKGKMKKEKAKPVSFQYMQARLEERAEKKAYRERKLQQTEEKLALFKEYLSVVKQNPPKDDNQQGECSSLPWSA